MESSNTNQSLEQASPPPAQETQQQVNVFDVEIKDESTALNVIVTFINLAQKRGAFNIQESAKIWDCIKLFQANSPPPPQSQ